MKEFAHKITQVPHEVAQIPHAFAHLHYGRRIDSAVNRTPMNATQVEPRPMPGFLNDTDMFTGNRTEKELTVTRSGYLAGSRDLDWRIAITVSGPPVNPIVSYEHDLPDGDERKFEGQLTDMTIQQMRTIAHDLGRITHTLAKHTS